ncbi:hypothetical protein QTI33_09370 [Variovorax sp. J22P271]|uniref:hypothetical protein n=1 Tax=Variovorax davisae TaxID=3053515 RepID=UPI0025759EA6|nr:hypothetical protein [Variovorax sp. J22P271]MDM0032335.1 hypothetical protein [Variovorax sp. J22P271]
MSLKFVCSTRAESSIDIPAIGLQFAAAFFTGLGEVMRDGIPQPAVLDAFGQRWGVEFLGPPLGKASESIEGTLDH